MKNRSRLIVSIIKGSAEYQCNNIDYKVEGEYVIVFEPKHYKEGRNFFCTSIISMLSPIFNGYIHIEGGEIYYKVY